MREILFKAICKYPPHKWIYGLVTKITDDYCIIHSIHDDCVYTCYVESLSEFTGSYDKNKNKIFENDYIGCKFNIVEFSYGSWNINGDRRLSDYVVDEVVGNRYDNLLDAVHNNDIEDNIEEGDDTMNNEIDNNDDTYIIELTDKEKEFLIMILKISDNIVEFTNYDFDSDDLFNLKCKLGIDNLY